MIRLLYIFLLIPALCFAGPFSNYYRSISTTTTTIYHSANWNAGSVGDDWTGQQGTGLSIASGEYKVAHTNTTDRYLYKNDLAISGEARFIFDIELDEVSSLGASDQIRILYAENSSNSRALAATITSDGSGNINDFEVEARLDGGSDTKITADISAWNASQQHTIEIRFTPSTGAGNDDGTAYLYVDDVLKDSATGLDNDTKSIDDVWLGHDFSTLTTTTLDLYFDNWQVTDGN
jgi:hypothetical protein